LVLTLGCLALAGGLSRAVAEVRLPRVFSDHMVLQQGQPVVVWGWAAPGESIEVQLGGNSARAVANDRGEWKVTLPKMAAGGPHGLQVKGSSSVKFEDVLVGEVWLCSGQSNMEMGINAVRNGKAEAAAADYPRIRLLMVPNKWTPEPRADIEPAAWKVCTPQTIVEGGWNGFSAVGFLFGRELHQKLGVPVGLIDATWGGTVVQSWTPPEGFGEVPALQAEYERVLLGDPRSSSHQARLEEFLKETERWLGAAREAKEKRALVPPMPVYPAELLPPGNLQHATALYNGMIHPLAPFGIRGAIWYQGESNLDDGARYADRMKALVAGWRKVWGQGEFPFFFVQIAPYNYGGEAERMGPFWEAQARAAAEIPNAGLAVINDIGDLKDIHPANKHDVAHRLALLALAKTYGQQDVVWSGPTFKSLSLEGDKLRVSFDHAEGGLVSRDGKPLTWFEIIDAEEGGFVPATAQMEGSIVVLSAPEVKRPVAVRFAWNMLAEPNLANRAGLPAGAFRAGDIPQRDLLALKVPEAKRYQLLYDLDLAKLGPVINWDQDNREKIHRPFDRVAYFLELQTADGNTQYLYASMDAFTTNLNHLGIPTLASGARFQQAVSGLNVFSNVKGIVTGTNLSGGYLEFWPNNYGTANAAGVAGASGSVYDFGDEPADPADGYGCMQVHNIAAKQTLFAINHWREGSRADLGIGNQSKNQPDWTFSGNAESYKARRLRVLVRLKP